MTRRNKKRCNLRGDDKNATLKWNETGGFKSCACLCSCCLYFPLGASTLKKKDLVFLNIFYIQSVGLFSLCLSLSDVFLSAA